MIFVIVGSQKFQFNRLLQALDELIEAGIVTDTVFAQTGESDYLPKHFAYAPFLDRDSFAQKVAESSMVITHGGTGAIIGAVKRGKPVVAVPRRAVFAEHVDDHQLEIIGQFGQMGMLVPCYEMADLGEKIKEAQIVPLQPYLSNTKRIIQNIDAFISNG